MTFTGGSKESLLQDWWRNAVVYEIYVQSFVDSDGDGVGDIQGIISRLNYLEWLGVDALWLTPIMQSPGADQGYDVSDYLAVDPRFGTTKDLCLLISDAGRRGIRIVLDLVANHTSIEHSWFRSPQTRPTYYIWAERPNNWVSTFHTSSWTYDRRERRYYLHSYLPQQPDLNWWNEAVRERFDEILRYWFDRGVAGFRIDACYLLIKDWQLRDNPPAEAHDHMWDRNRGQRPVWNANQPEVHALLRRWRRVAERYPEPRVLMGATWVPRVEELASYYGHGDELQLPQYMQLLFTPFQPRTLQRAVESWLAAVPRGEVPVWAGSSHDFSRLPSRWCDENPTLVRTALTLLLTLPGACILYQGDELGMPDTVLPTAEGHDLTGQARDTYRTPMPWNNVDGGDFTAGHPWLRLGDVATCNVADQLSDPTSLLHHTRWLIKQKKALRGAYRLITVCDTQWCYQRGQTRVTLDFRSDERNKTKLEEMPGEPRPADQC